MLSAHDAAVTDAGNAWHPFACWLALLPRGRLRRGRPEPHTRGHAELHSRGPIVDGNPNIHHHANRDPHSGIADGNTNIHRCPHLHRPVVAPNPNIHRYPHSTATTVVDG